MRKELTAANARALLKDSDLVIDAFDNSAARRAVRDHAATANVPCLHVGLHDDYCEAVWNEDYRVPADVSAGDPCAYPMARNLVLMAVVMAAEAVVRFIHRAERGGLSGTLGDLAIRPLEPNLA